MSAKKISILLGLLIVAATITAAAGFPFQQGQGQSNPPPNAPEKAQSQGQSNPPPNALEKAEDDFYTVVDYAAPEPADLQKREVLRTRNKRYNMRLEKGVDPARFRVTEERESSFGGPPAHAPVEPAFPAAQSDVVLTGEITDAQAHLTEDKTGVYSEFTVLVEDVLKNSSPAPMSSGSPISALRAGGAVRFPSGKVIRYGQHGKPLPRAGRRYVFFLKANGDGGLDFTIITAYELRAGRVFPLDGVNLVGMVEPAYAEYQKHKDAAEASFMNEVRDAIARNAGAEAGRREALR